MTHHYIVVHVSHNQHSTVYFKKCKLCKCKYIFSLTLFGKRSLNCHPLFSPFSESKLWKWPSWTPPFQFDFAHFQLPMWLAHIRRLVDRPFPISWILFSVHRLCFPYTAWHGCWLRQTQIINHCLQLRVHTELYRFTEIRCAVMRKVVWIEQRVKGILHNDKNYPKCEITYLSENLILPAIVCFFCFLLSKVLGSSLCN